MRLQPHKERTFGAGDVQTSAMNISRFFTCALLTLALPALAQPDAKPGTELPYPKVTPEDAAKLGLTEKPMQFHLRDVTLSDALDSLQRQSGKKIGNIFSFSDNTLQKKLSLDSETRSFNEALSSILQAADVKAHLETYGSGGQLNLYFGEDINAQDAVLSGKGAFQLRVRSVDSNLYKIIHVNKTAAPTKNQNSEVNVSVTFVFDPQLPVSGSVNLRLTRAEDEHGHSLLPKENSPLTTRGYTSATQTQIPLLLPQPDAQTIAHFEGIATYVLASKREKWEVPDVMPAKNVDRSFQSGGQAIRIVVQSAEKTKDGLRINIHVIGPATNKEVALDGPLLSSEQISTAMELTDAKGRAWEAAGYSSVLSGNDNNVNVTFWSPPSQTPPVMGMDGQPMDDETPKFDGPIKLTFNVPTEFVQTQVPFSFHDLPLP